MLSGKCALVTGAAKGLGRGFAEAMLKEKATVFLVDIDEDLVRETCQQFKDIYGDGMVYWGQVDVAIDSQLEVVFETAYNSMGHLDIVANNAGILKESNYRKMVDINLSAMIRGTQLAMEYMRKPKDRRGGCIINTSSVAGLINFPISPTYCATKSGIIAYSSSIAWFPQTQADGIRINCICPGTTNTDLLKVTQGDVLDLNTMQKTVADTEIIEISTVVDAFMAIIRDKEMNGKCMQVDPTGQTVIQPETFIPK